MGLALEGARLAMYARGEDGLERTARESTATTDAKVFWRRADRASATDIPRLIKETWRHFGYIDMLVTNVGGPPPGSFLDFTDDDWLAALNLNLLSTIRLIHGILPQMCQQQ